MKKTIYAAAALALSAIFLMSFSNGKLSEPGKRENKNNQTLLMGQGNPCDNLPTLEEMRVEQMDRKTADSLYRLFDERSNQKFRGSCIARDVARYLICNGADTIFSRFSIKAGTADKVTLQYVGKGNPDIILTPIDFVPLCPTICNPPN